ncbi:unnamed protein product, partial [Rotaria magnacalcarata]
QVIPLHNKETLNRLRDLWVWPHTAFKRQPIDDIRKYFGVKIAFYFCWIRYPPDCVSRLSSIVENISPGDISVVRITA